jgi:hypothetical protein
VLDVVQTSFDSARTARQGSDPSRKRNDAKRRVTEKLHLSPHERLALFGLQLKMFEDESC